MRKILYLKNELTVEEYIKKEICKNAGTQSVAFKNQLIEMCQSIGATYEDKMSKNQLFDLLIKNGCSYKMLAEKFGVGVSSQVYQSSLGISHQEVKKLEKRGVLNVVGKYRFRAYGKYMYAPLYDIYQFASMQETKIKGDI